MLDFRLILRVYWKEYHRELAAVIFSILPWESVMVKNSDGARGDGVLVGLKSKLGIVLKIILREIKNTENFYSGWFETQRYVFVSEEIVWSKPVTYRVRCVWCSWCMTLLFTHHQAQYLWSTAEKSSGTFCRWPDPRQHDVKIRSRPPTETC
jgi:hypothetical protein